MKIRYTYNNKFYFKQTQANCQFSSQNLEKVLKKFQSDSTSLVLLDHQLLKSSSILGIEKMNPKEDYSIIISSKVNMLTFRC